MSPIDLAISMAKEDGVDLSGQRVGVFKETLKFVCDYYERNKAVPFISVIGRHMEDVFGIDFCYLSSIFEKGIIRQICKYASLPLPSEDYWL